MVLGHTGCLAVGQLLDGDKGGAGGLHRFAVLNAVYHAKAKRAEDLYRAAVEENASQTVHHLARDLYTLRSAILAKTTSCVAGIYEMETGEVKTLEAQADVYGRF
jgi:carbonic anhydrase